MTNDAHAKGYNKHSIKYIEMFLKAPDLLPQPNDLVNTKTHH